MTLLTFISNQIEYQKGMDGVSGFLNHLMYYVLPDFDTHSAFQLCCTKRRNANSFITFPIFSLRHILAINILKIPT